MPFFSLTFFAEVLVITPPARLIIRGGRERFCTYRMNKIHHPFFECADGLNGRMVIVGLVGCKIIQRCLHRELPIELANGKTVEIHLHARAGMVSAQVSMGVMMASSG